ncbi:MAG: 30S ribosome-binding factor RbfA [Bacteroidetes bacterium]|nr:30S ribosome-binding factor RbfA [Bacteroidota bacterium]MCH8522969.1 30S ribosome-binding factor RbfA [Balneolales bacterium]
MSIRTERIAAQLKRDMGPLLQKYQRGSMITVTTVRVSDDLMVAKIYLSIYTPDGDNQSAFEYVLENATEIRSELASLIRHQVRRIPELHFYLDDTAEYVNRIEHLFKKIKDDRDTRQG